MKWDKAVKKIEDAISNNALCVSILYHRKHDKNESHWEDVKYVSPYEFEGKTCKAVFTTSNCLDEDAFVIDDVCPDYFFKTTI